MTRDRRTEKNSLTVENVLILIFFSLNIVEISIDRMLMWIVMGRIVIVKKRI